MGIEIFDSTGHLVAIDEPLKQVHCELPEEALALVPDYVNDPRTVEHLVDGHNYTTDDLHAWVAPFKVNTAVLCLFLLLMGHVFSVSLCSAWVQPFGMCGLGPTHRGGHDPYLELQHLSHSFLPV
jgi:hypothetical protein